MKILYLVHRFLPDHFRGSEVYTFELARQMTLLGHRVLVVSLRESENPEPEILTEEYQGLRVARILKKLNPGNFQDYFFDARMDELFWGLCRDFQPDLIHSIYFLGGLSLGMLEKIPGKIPLVLTITDYSPLCPRGQLLDGNLNPCPGPRKGLRCLGCLFEKRWLFSQPALDRFAVNYFPLWLAQIKTSPELKLIQKRWQAVERIFQQARKVIFAHPHTLKIYLKNRLKPAQWEILDFGVNFAPYLSHKKTASERLRIGFIGQLLPHKGLHLLVEALSEIPQQEKFELLIYGEMKYPQEKKYFESLALGRIKHWRFLGSFDYGKMNQVLEGIDLLVVPSLWAENCPLVPKYALLTGTGLLISAQPGILPKGKGEGIWIFKDQKELKEILEQILKNQFWKAPAPAHPELVMNMEIHARILERIYQGEICKRE